jgi:type II secretory pathway pseudopilin PulG
MSARRPAFTIFQLLVVIALFAFLLALALPLLFRVRVAAARAQSANNLKQIGLACHNYHATYNLLPPGNDAHNFSVAARILPFVEQANLYQLIKFDKPCDDPANAQVRGALIKVFLDPRDSEFSVVPGSGPTNYLFNAGAKPALAGNDGVFYQDSKIKFTDITDGTSNTLMAGNTLKGDRGTTAKDVHRQYVRLGAGALKDLQEDSGEAEWKADKHIAGDRCSSWIDGRFLQGTFTGTRLANDSRPDVSCGGAGGLSGLRSMDRTIEVLLCDGSVRTMVSTVGLETWKRLAARNDGQVIPDF